MTRAKFFLATVLTTAALALLSVPASAETRYPSGQQPVGAQAHHPTWEVFYRSDPHHGWRLYGTYHSHHQADHAADHLRHHGYQVRIEHHD